MVSKQVYHEGFAVICALIAISTAYILRALGQHPYALLFAGGAGLCLSISFAVSDKGYNRAIWSRWYDFSQYEVANE